MPGKHLKSSEFAHYFIQHDKKLLSFGAFHSLSLRFIFLQGYTASVKEDVFSRIKTSYQTTD